MLWPFIVSSAMVFPSFLPLAALLHWSLRLDKPNKFINWHRKGYYLISFPAIVNPGRDVCFSGYRCLAFKSPRSESWNIFARRISHETIAWASKFLVFVLGVSLVTVTDVAFAVSIPTFFFTCCHFSYRSIFLVALQYYSPVWAKRV